MQPSPHNPYNAIPLPLWFRSLGHGIPGANCEPMVHTNGTEHKMLALVTRSMTTRVAHGVHVVTGRANCPNVVDILMLQGWCRIGRMARASPHAQTGNATVGRDLNLLCDDCLGERVLAHQILEVGRVSIARVDGRSIARVTCRGNNDN